MGRGKIYAVNFKKRLFLKNLQDGINGRFAAIDTSWFFVILRHDKIPTQKDEATAPPSNSVFLCIGCYIKAKLKYTLSLSSCEIPKYRLVTSKLLWLKISMSKTAATPAFHA